MSDEPKPPISLKLIFTAILVLLSAIPSTYVQELISERESTRELAMEEVASKWGGAQTITGPILTIPYQTTDSTKMEFAYFLPETLGISGDVETEMRSRGIYDISIYNGTLTLDGTFIKPDFESLNIEQNSVHWDEAYLAIGVSDLKGLEQEIQLDWNGVSSMLTEQKSEPFGTAMSQKISGLNSSAKEMTFTMNLSFKGSNELLLTPVGKNTSISIGSNWTSPSFSGFFLPENHEITDSGFDATWNIFYLNRNYPQAWTGDSFTTVGSEAGIVFYTPADAYHMTTRAVKYMMLFVFLTFFIFFFIEILNRQKLHPVHYLLVGFALILFYLLLLSLSEHIGFGGAYFIAAVSIVGVIGSYSKSILGTNKLALFISSVISVLYLALYVILQLSDYALLIGTLLLFLVLTTTMYFTRKIDWYNLK